MVRPPSPRSPDWLEGVDLNELTDEAYFLKMRACGKRVRDWDDRYIGLLVGANDRNLPGTCGFRDIFHMAAIQARMSRQRVQEVLGVADKVRCCPGLYRLFMRAGTSWTKVRTVARMARLEWDEELCVLVGSRTRSQLAEWVREREAALHGRHPFVAHSRTSSARNRGTGDAGVGAARDGVAGTAGDLWTADQAGVTVGVGGAGTGSAGVGVGTPDAANATRTQSAGDSRSAPSHTGDSGTRADAGFPQGGTAGPPEPPAPPAPFDPTVAPGPTAGATATPAVTFEPGTLLVPEGAIASAGAPSQGVPVAWPAPPSLAPAAQPTPCPQTSGSQASGSQASESSPATDPQRPANPRVARPDRVVETLKSIGLDLLDIQQVLLHREALTGILGRTPSLVEVLSQAIRSYRPSGQAAKLPYLLVLTRCRECERSSVDTAFGSAPVDDADEGHLRQSGPAVDLDVDLFAREWSPVSAGLSARATIEAREETDDPIGEKEDEEDQDQDRDRDQDEDENEDDRAGAGAAARDDHETGSRTGGRPGVRAAERTAGGSDISGRTGMGGRPAETSRDLPAAAYRFLLARQGGRCAARGCCRPPCGPHHLDHFAHTRHHDLDRVWLLCRLHHRLAHGGFLENPADSPDRWRLRLSPGLGEPGGRARGGLEGRTERSEGPPMSNDAARLGRGACDAEEPVDRRREALDERYREHVRSPARRDEELARLFAHED